MNFSDFYYSLFNNLPYNNTMSLNLSLFSWNPSIINNSTLSRKHLFSMSTLPPLKWFTQLAFLIKGAFWFCNPRGMCFISQYGTGVDTWLKKIKSLIFFYNTPFPTIKVLSAHLLRFTSNSSTDKICNASFSKQDKHKTRELKITIIPANSSKQVPNDYYFLGVHCNKVTHSTFFGCFDLSRIISQAPPLIQLLGFYLPYTAMMGISDRHVWRLMYVLSYALQTSLLKRKAMRNK